MLGRPLSLSLVRAEESGLAVLSVPQRSVIPALPEIEPDAFRALVAGETGCVPVGEIQTVTGGRGAVALVTGLSCS